MESGSRRGSRLSTLLEDCPRPDLASFQHFSLASDFCRNANAVTTLPSLHDPLFNDFIHPFSKNRFERTFGFGHLSVVISHQFLTRVVFFIFSIFIFYIYFLKAFIIEGATKFGWIWMVFRQRWRGKEKRRTLVNLGRNRECQGRNSLRLVFVFTAFYRSKIVYPIPAILKRGTPISSHSITPISRSSNAPKISSNVDSERREYSLSLSLFLLSSFSF